MKPSGAWLGRLVVAGSCLAWVGCGGSDVPDPDSDASAAQEPPVKVVDKGAEPAAEAPAPKAPEEPAKPQAEASGPRPPAPVAEVAAQPAPAAESSPSPTPAPTVAEAEKPAAPAPADGASQAPAAADPSAVKGDASGTEEMLRMASSPPPAGPTAEASPAASTPSPASPSSGGATLSATVPGSPPAGRGRGGMMPSPSVADAAGAPSANPGGRPRGGFGGEGDAGGPGSNAPATPTRPGAFNQPTTAVDAFLNALKAKNKDQLAEATARRSATEAVEKHRKIFAEIIEGSISDVELDEMADAMAGYRVMYQLPAKSTGRIGVVISKQQGMDRIQRTVIARKERDGWKVMDIEGAFEFKPIGAYRRPARR